MPIGRPFVGANRVRWRAIIMCIGLVTDSHRALASWTDPSNKCVYGLCLTTEPTRMSAGGSDGKFEPNQQNCLLRLVLFGSDSGIAIIRVTPYESLSCLSIVFLFFF